MKKHLLFILNLLILISILSSCCNEPDCPQMSDDEKSWFPYKNINKLIFENFEEQNTLQCKIYDYSDFELMPESSNEKNCDGSCVRITDCKAKYFLNDTIELWTEFTINKISELYVVSNPGSGFLVGVFDRESHFDLREAVLQDSVIINGIYINEVYKYTTYPEVEYIAETYVKQGMGLVKIVFRDGQDYELVEHIKAN